MAIILFSWKDKWCGQVALKYLFSRLYSIEVRKNCLVADRIHVSSGNNPIWCWKRNLRKDCELDERDGLLSVVDSVNLSMVPDKWIWKEEISGLFSVSSLRRLMEEKAVISNSFWKIEWVNWIPLKVNCFVWRLSLDRVPVAANLLQKGVVLNSDRCPLCRSDIETTDHVFFGCSFAKQVWFRFLSWCSVSSPVPDCSARFMELLELVLADKNKEKMRKSLLYAAVWCIWKTRNDAVFRCIIASPFKTADEIKLMTYNWVKFRSRFSSIAWFDWIVSPFNACFL